MPSEQTMTDVLSFRIQIIKNDIGVAFVACRKHDDLAHFRQFFQKLFGKGSNIDPGVNLFPGRKLDLQSDIMGKGQILVAMDEGLIEIENERALV